MNRNLIIFALIMLVGCQSQPTTYFKSLPDTQTGITFNNEITDSPELSILNYEYIYNGGGVAIGDLNGDDLQDIVFTGNMVDNAIYLNKGNMQFEDISEVSGILGEKRWSTGVSLVDVNTDGLLDIYITASGHDEISDMRNQLYINQGTNADGVPTFKDEAIAYGIADTTNSTHAVFFDYDNDMDLDLFVIVNKMPKDRNPSYYRPKIKDGTGETVDRLYENVWDETLGHPVFKDVSKEAGILMEGYSLAVNICDINQDGWKDIYISNDYLSNDLLYVNNQDGTFTDKAEPYLKHTSFSAMGNDVIDINNDGYSDIIALDMLPKDNYRRKTMIPGNKYVDYLNNEKYGFQHQYMRNTLQLHRGVSELAADEAMFNDIGLMAGISGTDWSWTPLVADFDNDGFRDIIVTNGFPKDITDRDYIDYSSDVRSFVDDAHLLTKIPSVKLKNYAFRNNGNLTFENVTDSWGITEPSFSNGAAYGDLDNDGDLDYVVNNIGSAASVFENQNLKQQNWLRVQLKGSKTNPLGIGAKVKVYDDSLGILVNDFTLTRGYLSSNEPFLHFGVGTVEEIDSVVVEWQDGNKIKIAAVKVNQVQTIEYGKTILSVNNSRVAQNFSFNEVASDLGVDYVHKEVDYIDYNIQTMLPHKLSQYGPSLAVGDANGDGLDDLFIGGSHFEKGTFLVQQENGQFLEEVLIQYETEDDYKSEELGAIFFDADGDGDNDLYVTHGGYEYDLVDSQYIDRIYKNENGKFVWDKNALPQILSSGLAVKAADYDKDGDLDLFMGGRVDPGNYPRAVSSYIFRNESENGAIKFVNATEEVASMLTDIGMVSDALWTDFDNDGLIDLVLAGEYMPIRFLKNEGQQFKDITDRTGIAEQTGWWNSLTSGDFDQDGDIDYMVGNTGRNTVTDISEKHPIRAYLNDFDKNDRLDLIPTCYFEDQNGEMQEYPYFGRLEIMKQYNTIMKKYVQHKLLAVATMDEIFTEEEMEGCLVLAANNFNTSYIENLGNGQFKMTALPMITQRAPIYGMQTTDVNGDGYLDVLMVGNDYGMEVSVGRMDAHDGLVAYGNGNGTFDVQSAATTGFRVQGDAKALVKLHHQATGGMLHIASQNLATLKVYQQTTPTRVLELAADDVYAMIQLKNGKQFRQEFCYGAGFISQSSRSFGLTSEMVAVEVYNIKGEHRSIKMENIEE